MPSHAHPAPIRLGEKRPFYASATAPTGSTHTVSGTSTVTLYDKSGAVAGGVNGTNVTGQEAGAQSELLAWYVLDPSTLNLTAGVYRLVFKIVAVGSDGITRTFFPSVFIVVKEASGG